MEKGNIKTVINCFFLFLWDFYSQHLGSPKFSHQDRLVGFGRRCAVLPLRILGPARRSRRDAGSGASQRPRAAVCSGRASRQPRDSWKLSIIHSYPLLSHYYTLLSHYFKEVSPMYIPYADGLKVDNSAMLFWREHLLPPAWTCYPGLAPKVHSCITTVHPPYAIGHFLVKNIMWVIEDRWISWDCYYQWIDFWRGNLGNHRWFPFSMGFSCKFSHHPSLTSSFTGEAIGKALSLTAGWSCPPWLRMVRPCASGPRWQADKDLVQAGGHLGPKVGKNHSTKRSILRR